LWYDVFAGGGHSCPSPAIYGPGFGYTRRTHLYVAEDRVDVEGVHRLYEHADVVRQHLAQSLVNLPGVTLASQGASELPFIIE
jgi:hypothetical protein